MVSALQLGAMFKCMEQAYKQLGDTLMDKMKDEFDKVKEGNSYKGIDSLGAEVVSKTTTSKDYKETMDPVLESLQNQHAILAEQIKERKAFLDTVKAKMFILDEESGEIVTVFPVGISKTSTLAFSWKTPK